MRHRYGIPRHVRAHREGAQDHRGRRHQVHHPAGGQILRGYASQQPADGQETICRVWLARGPYQMVHQVSQDRINTQIHRRAPRHYPMRRPGPGRGSQERERENNKSQRHPLAEWGWTEADCLAYCRARGYDWGGLYDRFKRVSCWCCPLQQVGELRKLWQYYPELWARLEEYDRILTDGQHNDRPFKEHRIAYYTRRFEREARAQREQTTLMQFEEASND